MEMSEMCRACLSTGEDMVLMDETFVNKYNGFTNLNIKHNEDVPVYTCQTCFEAVNFCMEFKEKCISSDVTFNELLIPKTDMIPKIEHDTKLIIKPEIKSEYDSDSNVYEDGLHAGYDTLFDENCDIKPLTKLEEVKTQIKPRKSTRVAINKIKKTSNNKIEDSKASVKRVRRVKKRKIFDIIEDKNKILKHCGLCTKKFENMELLLKHLEEHKGGCCEICLEKFLDFTHILAHRICHVPDDQKRCHICLKKYIAATTLEFHYMKTHNHRGEDGKLLCKICMKAFPTARFLNKHLNTSHCETKPRYKCNECDKWFRNKSVIKSHMVTHKDDRHKTFKCDFCDFTSKRRSGIREHRKRKHMVEAVKCVACGRVFSSQSTHDNHRCKHLLNVICPVCGITVSKSMFLKRHMRSHDDKKPFCCDQCPSTFKNKTTLKMHLNKHNGIRPYRCEHCEMSFFTQSVLIKHRRTHTGEKPYKCKLCSSAFTGNNNLKVHMKVHGLNVIAKRQEQPSTQGTK